jgi:hypothetical protein
MCRLRQWAPTMRRITGGLNRHRPSRKSRVELSAGVRTHQYRIALTTSGVRAERHLASRLTYITSRGLIGHSSRVLLIFAAA